MPDKNAVFVDIAYTMQWDTVIHAVAINKLKKEVIVRVKVDAIKRQANHALLQPIKKTDFKYPSGKFSIPVNAIN